MYAGGNEIVCESCGTMNSSTEESINIGNSLIKFTKYENIRRTNTIHTYDNIKLQNSMRKYKLSEFGTRLGDVSC